MPDQDEAGVAVGILAAGFEIEFAARVLAKEFIPGDRGQHVAVEEVQRVAIRVAGDVVHQVAQRDVLRARELRIILRDRIVDGQRAVLGEEQEGGAGELLGDGTNRELRVLLDGSSVVQRPFAQPFCNTIWRSFTMATERPTRPGGCA